MSHAQHLSQPRGQSHAPSALWNGKPTNEKEQMGRCADLLETALTRCGFTVRNVQRGNMYDRVRESNGWPAALHIALHTNGFNGKASGTRVHCYPSEESRRIGRLFQDPMKGTAPHMTIEENLSLAYLRTAKNQHAFFARVGKKDRAFFREQLAVLNMGLEDRMSQPVGLLSGGQRQALTLMMATMVPPKLLLLDEHTAALDPATAEKVLDITRRVVQQHKITTLMVTHNMKNALELGNRTLMMDSGHIVLDISGEKREKMTVTDLLEQFKAGAGKDLDNDRILLS